LSSLDPVSLSGDGSWLGISTTADFGKGIQQGRVMLWNSADDSLQPLGLDDAYFALLGAELSADGRWLFAYSFSRDEAHPAGLFRIDRTTGASELVSLATDSRRLMPHMRDHSLSADGQHVAFAAQDATRADVYVRDLLAGTTVCVSLAPDGTEPNGDSTNCSLSGDGRCIAFTSKASNLVAHADDAQPDLFIRELSSGRTVRVGVEDIASGDRTILLPALSADGRRAVFLVGVGDQETRVVLADIEWATSEAAEPR
jgi:Tol biopolymer transport system component